MRSQQLHRTEMKKGMTQMASMIKELMNIIQRESSETVTVHYLRSVSLSQKIPINTFQLVTMAENALQYAGPVVYIVLLYKIMSLAYDICQKDSVSNDVHYLFVALLCNSFTWSLYGILKENQYIYVTNIIGSVVGVICLVICHRYTATSLRYSSRKSSYLFLMSSITLSSILFNLQCIQYLGLLGSILLVSMSASPILSIHTALEDKNVSSLPFTTNLLLWINSLVWMTYGAVSVQDPLIYGPNIFALMISTMQMLVCVLVSSA